MERWRRGSVTLDKTGEIIEPTLPKGAGVCAIAGPASALEVENRSSNTSGQNADKVGPPITYFSRSAHETSSTTRAASTAGSIPPLSTQEVRCSESVGRTPFKGPNLEQSTRMSSASSTYRTASTARSSIASIPESSTSTARLRTSLEDFSPDRHRTDHGQEILSGSDDSDQDTLVGETIDTNGERIGSRRVVDIDGKPQNAIFQRESALGKDERESKADFARTPVHRVLHPIGLHESTPAGVSPTKGVPRTPLSNDRIKDPRLPPGQNVGRRGSPQSQKYFVSPQAVQPHSTQRNQSGNARRSATHPDGISPQSLLGGHVSNDEITTPTPSYDRGVQFLNDGARKLSSILSISPSPRRRESHNLHSGFNFTSESPTPSYSNRNTAGVMDISAVAKAIRGTPTHSRQSSLRSALSATSSRVHVAPPSVVPDNVPPEYPTTEPGSDEDTDDNLSQVNAPRYQRSDPAERDVEEGGQAGSGVSGEGGKGGVIAASVFKESRARLGSAATEASGLVLPCSPSDEEKVSYVDTGRGFILSFAIIAFISLTVGMWCYTLSSVYFWWYGVPATYFTVYTCCQYFGVALWGRDFQQSEHAKIVEVATEKGFMPTVDVFLPVCNEPILILANTWQYVAELDYPHLKVHVLDDGAQDEVRDLASAFGFKYIRRPNRPELKKAGNLRYAFSKTTGDYVLILDADFCPRSDFLREILPYFLDRTIGIVQTPQYFRYRSEQTWVERGAGVTQEFFYRLEQVNSDKFGGSCCCGSCAIYRRDALQPLGGMAAIDHSEDMYTGFKMTEFGYRLKFVPLVLAMGTCPDEQRSFFMQQYRWCMGTCSLVFTKEFWNSNVSKFHKLCFFNGMMYYTATAVLLFVGPLPILMLIWVAPHIVRFHHLAIVVPTLVFVAIIIPCWSKQKYDMSCHRVRIIKCYAHLYSIKDYLFGTAAAWVPSGGGAKRSSSSAYNSSVWLMTIYNTAVTALIVGGAGWRMTQFSWYHFVPSIVVAIISLGLNFSTLWGC